MSNYSGVQTGRMGNLFTGALVASGADHTIYVVLDSGILLTVVNTRLTNEFNRAVEIGYDLDTDPALLQVLEYSAIATTGGGHLIQNEGTSLTQRSKLNFIGNGVTAEDDGTSDTTRVTIPGNSFAFPASDNNYYVARNGAWVEMPPGSVAGKYRQWLYSAGGGELTILTDSNGNPLTGLCDLE